MRTYKIELRVDFTEEDDPRWEVITEACKEKARELYATAVMLKEKREPRIVFESGDMFLRDNELDIISPES